MIDTLSRRERQIMDILFTMGRASGPEIQERLPDQPSYSGVRTILRVLERKGHIRHIEEGMRYVYLPVDDAGESNEVSYRKARDDVFRWLGKSRGGRVPRSVHRWQSVERGPQRAGTYDSQGA